MIRISGRESFPALMRLTRSPPEPRVARPLWLRDPVSGDRVDQALVIRFAAPESYSGDDMVELHLHGSSAVTRRILSILEDMPGLRMAEAGEFTRRALLNGKLDLSEVEGIGDLLAAETEAQHRQAMRLMSGALTARADEWKARLVEALAMTEVTIDFADEDLPPDVLARAVGLLRGCDADMAAALAGSGMAERLREGFEVALVGPPNAGKSTLLNALAGRDVALTSEVAGTTRDVIEVRMDLRGLPVTLLDMAGIRASDETIEAMGVDRAMGRANAADLRIFLVEDESGIAALGVSRQDGDIVAIAKADLRTTPDARAVSGVTGEGIEAMLGTLSTTLVDRVAGAGPVSHARQRRAIETARGAVDAALDLLESDSDLIEIVGTHLRGALHALEVLAGRADTEAMLDVVFRRFCIGK